MKIAVAYVRCSTDMQDDSVEQQKREIQKWADANDYKVTGWYEDEGKSGTTFEKRPAFIRLMNRVERRPDFQYILVYDESRWGRPNNPRENTYWKVHAERFGVRVRVINTSSKHENDIGSFVTEVVESAEASEYSKKLARSTLRGCLANAQKGYSSGGTAPYGYVRIAVDKITGEKTRTMKPGEWLRGNQEKVSWELGDPLEVAAVRRIFELKASGVGYVRIADQFNLEGIPCPRRGRWRNKDQKWCQGTIQSILHNQGYYGVRVYNKHPKARLKKGEDRKPWTNDEKDWVIVENAHPPIIAKELFEKVNADNGHKFGNGNPQIIKSVYLLSGLMRCSRCGFNFSGRRYAHYDKYYYQDTGFINKGRSVCSSYLIPKDRVEQFVIQSIKENILASNIESRLREIIEQQLQQRWVAKDQTADQLEKAIASNNVQIGNLVDAVARGVSADTVIDRIKQLERERERLQCEKRKTEERTVKGEEIRSLAQAITQEVYEFEHAFQSASTSERKRLIRQFVLGIDIDRENNRALCQITKIPMVSHPVMDALMPSEFTIVNVPGGGLEPPSPFEH